MTRTASSLDTALFRQPFLQLIRSFDEQWREECHACEVEEPGFCFCLEKLLAANQSNCVESVSIFGLIRMDELEDPSKTQSLTLL